MAATMGHMSMLPAITCSNCGADVDLAMMGDHVCGATQTQASSAASLPPAHSTTDFLLRPRSPPPPQLSLSVSPSNVVVTTPSGGHRMNLGPVGTAVLPKEQSPVDFSNSYELSNPQPSPVDDQPTETPASFSTHSESLPTNSSSNPYFWQASSQSSGVDDLSASPAATSPASAPAASVFDANSPYSPLIPSPLSAPAPLADRPDSAAIFHQFARTDSLVPPPPPARSAARLKSPPAPLQLSAEKARGEDHLAPLSPVPNGANVLKRMDTIAPGPFDSRHKKSDSKDGAGKGFNLFRRKSNKRKKVSISGPTAILDAPPMPTAEPSLFVGGSLENASPVDEQNRSSKLDNFGQPLPGGPAPPRPARPGEVDGLLETLQSAGPDSPAERQARDSLRNGQWNASDSPSTYSDQALRDLDQGAPETGSPGIHGAPRVTSDMSVYTTVSSSDRSTTFGTELPQIREDEDREAETAADKDAPPAWPTGRLRSASRTAEGSKPRTEQVPPVPSINGAENSVAQQQQQPQSQQLHHTPTESVSSQDFGSVSDGRRESSRSSPPTSTTSSFSPSKQSMDDQRDVHSPPGDVSTSAAFNRTANFSRPRAPTDASAASPPKVFAQPAMPLPLRDNGIPRPQEVDQTPRYGALNGPPKLAIPPPRKASLGAHPLPLPRTIGHSPRYAGPGTFADAPPSPMLPITPNFPPMPPMPASERRPARKTSGAVKNCRGCDLPIEGKSVKASDGRLTGRYHRECFVCKACKERFPTADFYIHDDHPYCGQHYHELNGSICVDCSRGIEGRYIDTAGERKHHVYCFTCSECSKPLSQDYFEIDGKFYCEADADRVHQKSSMLAPGRKFPERRTTRLMMM